MTIREETIQAATTVGVSAGMLLGVVSGAIFTINRYGKAVPLAVLVATVAGVAFARIVYVSTKSSTAVSLGNVAAYIVTMPRAFNYFSGESAGFLSTHGKIVIINIKSVAWLGLFAVSGAALGGLTGHCVAQLVIPADEPSDVPA